MQRTFQKAVILTGAGISAESGVPVFRGPDGLWEGRRVEDVATVEAVEQNRWGVNDFFNGLRSKIVTIQPNPAHEAFAAFEKTFAGDFLLVTQNIDPLHEKAGSRNLAHMHGELLRLRCDACGASYPFYGAVMETTPCEQCRATGWLRPDIVLFNEMPMQMDRIIDALSRCDLFIAIGTSGFVYPAAGFVDIANHAHAYTIEVNTTETERSSAFQEHIIGTAGQRVPGLLKEILAD
jgi:NAD-dependent deacetylase